MQGQLNRYMLVDLNIENAIEIWSQRMTICKFITPVALDLLSAPVSQAFVEIYFSVSGLVTA